jgi:hypothetical protein
VPEASGRNASDKAAHPDRRIANKPFERSDVQQVLLSRIAKRLNPGTLPMLRLDRPGLQRTDKTESYLRFEHQNAVKNAHDPARRPPQRAAARLLTAPTQLSARARSSTHDAPPRYEQ